MTRVFNQTAAVKGTIITHAGEEDTAFYLNDPEDIQTIQQMLTGLNSRSEPQWPQFGFRGYGLKNQGIASLPPYIQVFQGVIEIFDDVGSNFYRDEKDLETFLSQKSSSTMLQLTAQQAQTKTKRDTPPKGLPKSGSEPPYEPDKWNKDPVISENNCYRYATNTKGSSFARPGRAGCKEPPLPDQDGYSCDNFVAAAVSDGLVKVDCDKACPKDSFKVALVIHPKTDYHWYRQDDNGNWSHKPGSSKATDKDNSGKQIVDPRTADRGDYTTFCSCFCVHPMKITIRRAVRDSLEGDATTPNPCPGGD